MHWNGNRKEESQRSWLYSLAGDCVGGQVGAGEVGVAGEGGSLLAIDQETDLSDARKIVVEGSADGEDGQSFGLQTGRMTGNEGAGQVYNCE
jgi:hypothetical protein